MPSCVAERSHTGCMPPSPHAVWWKWWWDATLSGDTNLAILGSRSLSSCTASQLTNPSPGMTLHGGVILISKDEGQAQAKACVYSYVWAYCMWKRMEVRKMWVEVINGEVRKLGGCRKTTEGCSLIHRWSNSIHTLSTSYKLQVVNYVYCYCMWTTPILYILYIPDWPLKLEGT